MWRKRTTTQLNCKLFTNGWAFLPLMESTWAFNLSNCISRKPLSLKDRMISFLIDLSSSKDKGDFSQWDLSTVVGVEMVNGKGECLNLTLALNSALLFINISFCYIKEHIRWSNYTCFASPYTLTVDGMNLLLWLDLPHPIYPTAPFLETSSSMLLSHMWHQNVRAPKLSFPEGPFSFILYSIYSYILTTSLSHIRTNSPVF